jgi:hypothetical protein
VDDCVPGPNLRRPVVGLDGKENRFGWPLRGVIWFTVAIALQSSLTYRDVYIAAIKSHTQIFQTHHKLI